MITQIAFVGLQLNIKIVHRVRIDINEDPKLLHIKCIEINGKILIVYTYGYEVMNIASSD